LPQRSNAQWPRRLVGASVALVGTQRRGGADEGIAEEHYAELGQCRGAGWWTSAAVGAAQRQQRALLSALTPKPGRKARPKRRRKR